MNWANASNQIDEVSALVLDIGSSTTRAGYAGDDTPRTVFSTTYGYIKEAESSEGAGDSSSARLFVGDHVTEWRANMEVANPMMDGISM